MSELYKEFRPKTFDDFVGNPHVISSVKKMIDNADVPKAILLVGPTGTGKTSLARIIKAAMGIKDFNYWEIDSVALGKVDFIREVRERLLSPPIIGGSQLYLFDEAHRISSTGQDQLLKALEDAPKHAFFILATTAEDKLSATLKHRCVTYHLRPFMLDDLRKKILVPVIRAKNPLLLDKELISMIAKMAEGSARKALTLLEMVIRNNKEEAFAILKKSERLMTLEGNLCWYIHQKDLDSCLGALRDFSGDPEETRYGVLHYFMKLVLQGRVELAEVLDIFRNSYSSCGLPGFVADCVKACERGKASAK